MILLISQKYGEPSTDDVIDWLFYLDGNYKRINGVDVIGSFLFDSNDMSLEFCLPNSVEIVWFRRWLSKKCVASFKLRAKEEQHKGVALQIMHFLQQELMAISEYFFDRLKLKYKVFNRIETNEINKLTVLRKAEDIGLIIPKTLITTLRGTFDKFNSSFNLITKSISNAGAIRIDKKVYKGYTVEIDEIDERIGDSFFPSLFQEKIEKTFEIRSFFISNQIFSMAIFSQCNDRTKIDFRNYDDENPNRMVPYKLPSDVEKKLCLLAQSFGLNTCSFDLIKNDKGRFIFLEVNPGGQFGMVSYPCNYFIEKIIATELIKLDN